MYYQPAFLTEAWQEYLRENKVSEAEVDPDAFVRWTYAPRPCAPPAALRGDGRNWGVTVRAEDVAQVQNPARCRRPDRQRP